MPVVGCCNDDRVEVFFFQQLPHVFKSFGLLSGDLCDRAVQHKLVDIADVANFYGWQVRED